MKRLLLIPPLIWVASFGCWLRARQVDLVLSDVGAKPRDG